VPGCTARSAVAHARRRVAGRLLPAARSSPPRWRRGAGRRWPAVVRCSAWLPACQDFERRECLEDSRERGLFIERHRRGHLQYQAYTTRYPHTQTQTQTCTGLYGGRQVSSLRDIARANRNQRLRSSRLRKLGRGGDPGAESGDQGWSNAREAGRRAPVIVILAGGDERRGRRAVRGRRGRARQELVGPGAVRGREGLKQLQFVLPAVKKLPLERLVGAGRGQGERRPGQVGGEQAVNCKRGLREGFVY